MGFRISKPSKGRRNLLLVQCKPLILGISTGIFQLTRRRTPFWGIPTSNWTVRTMISKWLCLNVLKKTLQSNFCDFYFNLPKNEKVFVYLESFIFSFSKKLFISSNPRCMVFNVSPTTSSFGVTIGSSTSAGAGAAGATCGCGVCGAGVAALALALPSRGAAATARSGVLTGCLGPGNPGKPETLAALKFHVKTWPHGHVMKGEDSKFHGCHGCQLIAGITKLSRQPAAKPANTWCCQSAKDIFTTWFCRPSKGQEEKDHQNKGQSTRRTKKTNIECYACAVEFAVSWVQGKSRINTGHLSKLTTSL